MLFQLKADIKFFATDIDNAFKILSEYFSDIDESNSESNFSILDGNIEVKKIEELK